jgi:hypothetical protein
MHMNYENFNAVLTHIERHPEQWDQKNWCGTSCCIAGHAAHMSGNFREGGTFGFIQAAEAFLGLPVNGWCSDLEEEGTADWLFNSQRSLDDFRRVRLVLARARLAAA